VKGLEHEMTSQVPAYHAFAPVVILVLTAVGLSGLILLLAHLIGPRRHGAVKEAVYESGVPPVAEARRRFRVRFYLVAILFLLFDVEVVLLWPWALVFRDAAAGQAAGGVLRGEAGKGFLLAEMAFFLAILLVGYVYAWRRGVFRWS